MRMGQRPDPGWTRRAGHVTTRALAGAAVASVPLSTSGSVPRATASGSTVGSGRPAVIRISTPSGSERVGGWIGSTCRDTDQHRERRRAAGLRRGTRHPITGTSRRVARPARSLSLAVLIAAACSAIVSGSADACGATPGSSVDPAGGARHDQSRARRRCGTSATRHVRISTASDSERVGGRIRSTCRDTDQYRERRRAGRRADRVVLP